MTIEELENSISLKKEKLKNLIVALQLKKDKLYSKTNGDNSLWKAKIAAIEEENLNIPKEERVGFIMYEIEAIEYQIEATKNYLGSCEHQIFSKKVFHLMETKGTMAAIDFMNSHH